MKSVELYETAPRETRTQENMLAFALFILSSTNFQIKTKSFNISFPPTVPMSQLLEAPKSNYRDSNNLPVLLWLDC